MALRFLAGAAAARKPSAQELAQDHERLLHEAFEALQIVNVHTNTTPHETEQWLREFAVKQVLGIIRIDALPEQSDHPTLYERAGEIAAEFEDKFRDELWLRPVLCGRRAEARKKALAEYFYHLLQLEVVMFVPRRELEAHPGRKIGTKRYSAPPRLETVVENSEQEGVEQASEPEVQASGPNAYHCDVDSGSGYICSARIAAEDDSSRTCAEFCFGYDSLVEHLKEAHGIERPQFDL